MPVDFPRLFLCLRFNMAATSVFIGDVEQFVRSKLVAKSTDSVYGHYDPDSGSFKSSWSCSRVLLSQRRVMRVSLRCNRGVASCFDCVTGELMAHTVGLGIHHAHRLSTILPIMNRSFDNVGIWDFTFGEWASRNGSASGCVDSGIHWEVDYMGSNECSRIMGVWCLASTKITVLNGASSSRKSMMKLLR